MRCLKDKTFVTFPDCNHCESLETCVTHDSNVACADPRFMVIAQRTFGICYPELITNGTMGWKTDNSDELLLHSIETARAAGVEEQDILHNKEEIDKFFES